MFKLDRNPTIKWPVTVVVTDDGGVEQTLDFTAIWQRVGKAAALDVMARAARGETDDAAVVREYLRGWDGVTDGETPAEFNSVNLDRLLDIPGADRALAKSFIASSLQAVAKN